MNAIPGLKSDISSGFYFKHKHSKSPGTMESSTSQSVRNSGKFGNKKLGGMNLSKHQYSVPDDHNKSDLNIYERKNKAGISALRQESRNKNTLLEHNKSVDPISIPPPAPIPNSNMLNSGKLGSGIISGGGLSKNNIKGLGRHQI